VRASRVYSQRRRRRRRRLCRCRRRHGRRVVVVVRRRRRVVSDIRCRRSTLSCSAASAATLRHVSSQHAN